VRVDLLDHGYVELVESWGSDERVIEAARMSTAKGFQGWGTADAPGDERLLRYLWTNHHHTPFEMGGLIVEVQAPIFVFREWHRHRTQSYNELSARYAALPDMFYVPGLDRMANAKQSATNKQSSEAADWSTSGLEEIRESIARHHAEARRLYEHLLAMGVAREIARVVLPVGQYSRMRASANLRNWLSFLTLRMAPNAQWEIRQFANAVGDLVAANFPRTWQLFRERV
jgi:thymidylate synthase (FAD)